MRIGIGLPTTTPGVSGGLLLEWARQADAGPFSSVAVLDRLVYDSVDPFVALGAAAAVTSRVRLATMISIGPLRSPAVLAKQASSVHLVAGGRLTLGLGIGARLDDYTAAGADHRNRGARLSEQLAHLRALPGDTMELLVGGNSGAALARMARYADGYAHGGGPPRAFASAAARARAAWHDLGRPGEPALWGQAYFALGDPAAGTAYLRDYYAFTGPFAETVAAANLTSAGAIRDLVRGYRAEGCDELVLLPTVADPAEVARLAEVLG
ncbi:MAG TPA: LLM class flavin-dependent oxidoreductase [Pseudonocardiaceae bacterium]|nr:LLM class flavin-dependent oxidoreductase [Pseudonocardiaceae bacterium]